jgi:hypothetical protein
MPGFESILFDIVNEPPIIGRGHGRRVHTSWLSRRRSYANAGHTI